MNPWLITTDDTDIMLAAPLSVLLVLLFVAILHYYTKWFLSQDCDHEVEHGTLSPSFLFFPTRLLPNPLGLHAINTTNGDNHLSALSKGLESSVISSIPEFVNEANEETGLECVICLSLFKKGEKGRKLEVCHHIFHIECIDMWLHSHTTCPICRAPAVKAPINGSDAGAGSSLSENLEADINMQNCREFFNLGGTRIGYEESNRLQIVVEVPNRGNGSDNTCLRKDNT